MLGAEEKVRNHELSIPIELTAWTLSRTDGCGSCSFAVAHADALVLVSAPGFEAGVSGDLQVIPQG
jgi:hypothetical protein